MTREEAEKEAIRRWGWSGMIFDRIDDARPNTMQHSISTVGRYWVGVDSFDFGNGNSWDEAFDQRDQKQAKRKENNAKPATEI